MPEKQLKLTALYVQPGIQRRQKKKQSWILCYGGQQECIFINMAESFSINKVLSFFGRVFIGL